MIHRLLPCLLLAFALTLTAELRDIHILQTADVHTQLRPTTHGTGGLLAAATVIRQARERLSPDRTLLIDCGDTTQGTIAATLSQGQVGLLPLKLLGYDVWVPGNHEFDYGIDTFLDFMRQTSDIALCANLTVRGQPPFRPWTLLTRNGLKIAVIGLTSSYMRNWLLPADAQSLTIHNHRTLLPKLLADIRTHQPDAIILAAHQGWVPNTDTRGVNDIEDIASRFPEIALILGAHTHRDFPGTTIGHRTWYLQPPPHANAVAHATLTIDTDAHRVVSVTSQLLPVPRNTPHDPELEQALLPFIRQEQHERQRLLVASLAQAIPSRGIPGTSCATSELIATAIAQATGAAVVFHGKLSNHELPAGKLHGHDLHRLLPYDNAIVTATLTLDDIQTILNEQLKWRRHYSFNGIYGATATLNPATGQATLTGLGKTGTLPPDTTNAQRLLVAFNAHAAAGSGRFTALRAILAQPQANTTQLNLSTRQAVENFLAKHPNLTLTPFPWLQ